MSAITSRDRSVRVVCSVFPNSPHARVSWSSVDHLWNFPHLRPVLAAHRYAHRHATALVTTGIGGLSLVAVSSAHGGGRRRGAADDMTSTADVGHPPGPPFANATPPGIGRKMCGVFSKLSLAGCFL